MTQEDFTLFSILVAEIIFVAGGVPPDFFFAAYATFVMTAVAGHM